MKNSLKNRVLARAISDEALRHVVVGATEDNPYAVEHVDSTKDDDTILHTSSGGSYQDWSTEGCQ